MARTIDDTPTSPTGTPADSSDRARWAFEHRQSWRPYPEAYRNTRRDRREVRCILACLAGVETGARVLDLPCGAGRLTRVLAGRGYRVTAADSSPAMIRRAESSWRRDGLGRLLDEDGAAVRFEVRDCMGTGYADGQFDAVVCNRLLHHFTEPQTRRRALAELARVSRGPVVVSFFNSFALDAVKFRMKWWLRRRAPDDRVPIPLDELKRDAAAAGLAVRRTMAARWGVSPQWYVVLGPAC